MPRGALISEWDNIIPGREAQSLEVFERLHRFWQSQQEAGRISSRQAFLSAIPGDAGFEVVDGDFDELGRLIGDESYRDISILARSVLKRLRTHLCVDAVSSGQGGEARGDLAATGTSPYFEPWARVNPAAAAATGNATGGQ
jgi:hypothetical protein